MRGDLAPAIAILAGIETTLRETLDTMSRGNDVSTKTDGAAKGYRGVSGKQCALLVLVGLWVGLWVGEQPYCHNSFDEMTLIMHKNFLSKNFERRLPKTFEEASIALRFAGFFEGNPMVGTDYRHRPVPEPNPLFEKERQTVSRFNELLSMYGAEMLRPFEGRADELGIRTIKTDVYLLKRKDGSFAVHAEKTELSVIPKFFPRLFR